MRIGIDCRMWAESGLGRYIRNIVESIAQIDSTNEYVLFVLSKDYDSISLPQNFTKVVTDYRWYTFSEQLLFPYHLYRAKLDLLFVPNMNVPLLYLKKIVVTVHDLIVLKVDTNRASTLPKPLYKFKRLMGLLTLKYISIRAKVIFAVSEFVKQDVVKTFGVKPDKIHVTLCAVDDKFKKITTNQAAPVLKTYNIAKPYLFWVGNAHPHKNLDNLIKAFEITAESHPNLMLALGGKKDFFYTRLENEWRHKPIYKKLRFLGFIADEDLPALYSEASCLVNASLQEGFGIQILEAFACGTKVACSKVSSLPEVGGNIAYYFNPKDPKNIAETINACLQDTSDSRVQAGYDRVKKFSWKDSARTIHEISTSI